MSRWLGELRAGPGASMDFFLGGWGLYAFYVLVPMGDLVSSVPGGPFFFFFFFRPWATVNSGFMLLRTEVLGRVLSVIAVMALAEERGEKPKW